MIYSRATGGFVGYAYHGIGRGFAVGLPALTRIAARFDIVAGAWCIACKEETCACE